MTDKQDGPFSGFNVPNPQVTQCSLDAAGRVVSCAVPAISGSWNFIGAAGLAVTRVR